MLASNYGLTAQLNCLNYCYLCTERTDDGDSGNKSRAAASRRSSSKKSDPRWVLADLSRDEILSLQQSQGEKEIGQTGWQGFMEEVTPRVAIRTQ